MFRQRVASLFLGVVWICAVVGVIGCDNFEALIIGVIDEDIIEPVDDEWIGTWTLESYQGLSQLEAVAEYDDYEEEDFTFLSADGSVASADLQAKAIAAFWSGDGVTGYDGSISYTFSSDGIMDIEIVIRVQMQVEGIQGVLVGKDTITGNYSLTSSDYTTEIADEVETGTWNRIEDTLTLNPHGGDVSTVLKKL